MKVILNQDIKGMGRKGEVKQVSDGYAANFLLPKKLAVIATEGNLREMEKELKARDKREETRKQEALEAQKKLQGAEVVVKAKANEEGHLFGSVEIKEITAALMAKGLNLDDAEIVEREPIKSIGRHKVEIKILDDIKAEIVVDVRAEK